MSRINSHPSDPGADGSLHAGEDTRSFDELACASNLTRAQLMMWLGERVHPNTPLYNMAVAHTLEGKIDSGAFGQAFQQLVAGNDCLHSVIVERDGVPFREESRNPPGLRLLDFSESSAPEGAAWEWMHGQTGRALRVSRTLYEAALIKLHADRWIWYLNHHHLMTDGVTVGLLFDRLQHLYANARQGGLDSIPDWPSHAACASEQRRRFLDGRLDTAVAYWKKHLPETVPDSVFYRATGLQTTRSWRWEWSLGASRTNALGMLARDKAFQTLSDEISRFQILCTVLAIYLHHVSGKREIVFGTPVHNRGTPIERAAAGLMMEVYPLCVDIQPDDTFVSLKNRIANQLLRNMAQARAGVVGPDLGRSYDVILNLITAHMPEFSGLPKKVSWLHSGHGDPNHRLRLQFHDLDGSGTVQVICDANQSAFAASDAARIEKHLLRLVDAMVLNPAEPVASTRLIDDAEYRKLYLNFNETHRPAKAETVVQLLDEQSRCTPDDVALVDGERRWTYRELATGISQLVHRLRATGVAPGSLVAIHATRSAETVMAMLAVWRCGAAYLPLDRDQPGERLKKILRDARPALALTDDTDNSTFASVGIVVMPLDEGEGADAHDQNYDDPQVPADATAYVIYTSGSTGDPKGVVVSHRALANYLNWARGYYRDGRSVSMPLFTSLAVDLTVTSVFLPLVSGGTVLVYREDEEDPAMIRRIIREDRADLVKLTPSHLELLEHNERRPMRLEGFILGGEDLKTRQAHRLMGQFGDGFRVYNEYGPTEATVGCMIHRFDPLAGNGTSVPIGVPIDNTEILLLDAVGQTVPGGVVGEICIAGQGLADGYLGQPSLTEQRFTRHWKDGTRRMYRTGDMGRFNDAGLLEYLGRADGQVKVNGFRVELGELEAALLEHPAVRQAAAVLTQSTQEPKAEKHCIRCGLSSLHPQANLDAAGVCHVCRNFENHRLEAEQFFGTMQDLRAILEEGRASKTGKYDCLMLVSGGKDSTYALCQLVEMGFNVLVFFLDNGYISQQAKENIRRVVDSLGLDLHVGTTSAMPAIFADSLRRFSNVCNGCFKTIYSLSLNLAHREGIPRIVTGLSRGQIFETRLAELFQCNVFDPQRVDQMILEARKAYHRMDDEVSRSLDVTHCRDDAVLDSIPFVDFYRYCDATLDEIYRYLGRHAPWLRPTDTGRSTNCLINEVGIYVHQKERGYHNYSLPYSWDVRLGHKQRDEALEELDDDIDEEAALRILSEVGYEPRAGSRQMPRSLVAFFVTDRDVSAAELREFLAARIPRQVIPSAVERVPSFPLTTSGKVDRSTLSRQALTARRESHSTVQPHNKTEQVLASVWSQVLGLPSVGVHDNFFDIGGDSIRNIQIVSRVREQGIRITAKQVFDHPTVAELARVATTTASEKPRTQARGPALLTPIQEDFFRWRGEQPHRYAQWLVIEFPRHTDFDAIKRAWRETVSHHDIFRLRFRLQDGTAEFVASPGESLLLDHIFAEEPSSTDEVFQSVASKLVEKFDLQEGPLAGAARVAGPSRSYLVIAIHHLLVDSVSWLIFLDDLHAAFIQSQEQAKATLPPPSDSVQEWASHLRQIAESPRVMAELPFWREQIGREQLERELVLDPASWKQATTGIEAPPEVSAMLRDVNPGDNQAVLLTALAWSLSDHVGLERVRVLVEHHGRELTAEDLDVSRTIGWFTSVFPLLLVAPTHASPMDWRSEVVRQLGLVPRNGIGFGILRYLHSDRRVREALATDDRNPWVLFNYLGRLDASGVHDLRSSWTLKRPLAVTGDPTARPRWWLECHVYRFGDELHAVCNYASPAWDSHAISQLCESMWKHVADLIEADDDGSSAAGPDVSTAGLSRSELDDVLAEFDQGQ